MLKLNKKCRVCIAVKESKTLLNEIYNSSFFMKRGKNLAEIQRDNQDLFTYESLQNHVKKHQFMDEEDFTSRHLRGIAKKAEKQILKRAIESKEVWDEVINVGMGALQDGTMQVKAADLLKASKDKSDFDLKVKDQQLAMAEMMWHFASGENNESRSYDRRFVAGQAVTNYDPSEEPSGHPDQGADGPDNIYHPTPWDALTQGPNPLPPGNNPA